MVAGMASLTAVFLVCLAATLRLGGLRVVAALTIAALVIGVGIPWMALRGVQPLAVALPGGMLTILVGSLLIGGWNRKSLAAALGAGSALLLAAALPFILAAPLQLTGLDHHFGPRPHLEVKLWYDPAYGRVDFKGLHLAVIILASVGALMDMAMVIASTVRQAMAPGGGSSFRALFQTGVRAGRGVLGPMLVTMLLIFLGADLAPTVARAALPGGAWESFRLLNYESIASHVLEAATAALGLLAGIPLTSFFVVWLLRRPGVLQEGLADNTVPRMPLGKGRFLPIGERAVGVAAILVGALAMERGYIASCHVTASVAGVSRQAGVHAALARVVSVQHPLDLPTDESVPHNPVRGPAQERLFPCAAEILTGLSRGRLATFMNRVQDRPHVSIMLRPGDLALLSLTAGEGGALKAVAYPPPMRWRPLLLGVAIIMSLTVAGLGGHGLRAILLTAFPAAALGFVAVPLLGKGLPPAGAVIVSFAVLTVAMLMFWEAGMRSTCLTSAATLLGLLTGGVFALGAMRLMGITGAASATNRLLLHRPDFARMDFSQLLCAGMAIMVMGAALDIAAGVVGGLAEFRRANPSAPVSRVLRAGIGLNGDLAGMMVLTLFIAWLALRLPVLLMMRRTSEVFGPQWI